MFDTGFPIAAWLSYEPINIWMCLAMALSSSLQRYVTYYCKVNPHSCESCAYEFFKAYHTKYTISKPTTSLRASSISVPMIHPWRRWPNLCQALNYFIKVGVKLSPFVFEVRVVYLASVESISRRCSTSSWLSSIICLIKFEKYKISNVQWERCHDERKWSG